MLGIVVLNYNSSSHTFNLLSEIAPLTNTYTVVVVDNCSTKKEYEILKHQIDHKFNSVALLRQETNLGYFKGNFAGVEYLKEKFGAKYALILNPDVGCDNWNELINHFKNLISQKDYFIVGAKVVIPGYKDISSPLIRFTPYTEAFFNLAFPFSYILRRYLIATKSKRSNRVFAVEGSAYFIDAAKMESIKQYYQNVFLYGEEIIYGLIAEKKGWTIYYDNTKVVNHYHPPRLPGSSYETFYLATIKEILKQFNYSWITSKILIFSFRYKMMVRALISFFINKNNNPSLPLQNK